MKFECPECRCQLYSLVGNRLTTTVEVYCDECSKLIAEFDQIDFIDG
jgi:hypothetical protein